MKETEKFDFEKVQKDVRKKNIRRNIVLVLLAGIMTLVLYIFGGMALNKFFYNPMAGGDAAESNQYIFNRQVSTELLQPAVEMPSWQINQTGIGTYQIVEEYDQSQYGQVRRDTRRYTLAHGKLSADETYSYNLGEAFFYTEYREPPADFNREKLNLKTNLKELPKTTYLLVNVLFKEDKTLKELSDWRVYQAGNGEEIWLAVRGPKKKSDERVPVLGFASAGGISGRSPELIRNAKVWKEFPDLKPSMNRNEGAKTVELETERANHFKDLLKYLQTQEDFLALESEHNPQSLPGKKALANMEKYVEKNGVNIFGGTLWLSVTDLISMLEKDQDLASLQVVSKDVLPLSGQSGMLSGLEYPED